MCVCVCLYVCMLVYVSAHMHMVVTGTNAVSSCFALSSWSMCHNLTRCSEAIVTEVCAFVMTLKPLSVLIAGWCWQWQADNDRLCHHWQLHGLCMWSCYLQNWLRSSCWSALTMLSRHSVGTKQGNELICNSSGTPRWQSSQFSEPL